MYKTICKNLNGITFCVLKSIINQFLIQLVYFSLCVDTTSSR